MRDDVHYEEHNGDRFVMMKRVDSLIMMMKSYLEYIGHD